MCSSFEERLQGLATVLSLSLSAPGISLAGDGSYENRRLTSTSPRRVNSSSIVRSRTGDSIIPVAKNRLTYLYYFFNCGSAKAKVIGIIFIFSFSSMKRSMVSFMSRKVSSGTKRTRTHGKGRSSALCRF
jgi:hypothetical protein